MSVQAIIIDKSLNPSKLPYLDHYGLVEIKKFALEIIIFVILFNTSLGNLGFKIIKGRFLIADLRYLHVFFQF